MQAQEPQPPEEPQGPGRTPLVGTAQAPPRTCPMFWGSEARPRRARVADAHGQTGPGAGASLP